MKIIPLAFDSLGTRSMATFVKTDVKILIDPSAALGPSRYGLPPHPLEWKKLEEHIATINEYAMKSDILIVTHYHYDHHNPQVPEIFSGKIALIKHPTEKINASQKQRARYFLSLIKPKILEYADGKEFSFGDTKIKFSPPVFHGTNSRLGYVIEVCIEYQGEKFLHSSDVEGPAIQEQVDFILKEKPNVVFIDGPMTYMLGYKYSVKNYQKSIENLRKIAEIVDIIVLDHHLLRDLNWREKVKDVEKIKHVLSAAEFAGKKEELLEARRKELYETEPTG
jgi:hypothetical protein